MDLVKFMHIHYFGPNIITDDFQQDQQLPFRSMECHMQNVTACIQFQLALELHPPATIIEEFPSYDEVNKPQFSAFDIFQPPRYILS